MNEQNPQRTPIPVELDAEHAARVREGSALRQEIGEAMLKSFEANPVEVAPELGSQAVTELSTNPATVRPNLRVARPLITEIPEHLKPGK